MHITMITMHIKRREGGGVKLDSPEILKIIFFVDIYIFSFMSKGVVEITDYSFPGIPLNYI